MSDIAAFWSYLARGPLLWLVLTLAAYGVGAALHRRTRGASWANPVLVAMLLLGALLSATGTAYETYFNGAQFIHFLLGPATVALVLPLHSNLGRLKRAALPVMAALLAGSLVAVLSALSIGALFGLSPEVMASLAPKSATAPVAIGLAEQMGGAGTLTATLVILTGIIGAVTAKPLFNALGIRDWRARGLAVGVASHGIGTARAFQVHPVAGAFAGLGMALNAVLTALIAPSLLAMFQ